jgi:hypothetical protein
MKNLLGSLDRAYKLLCSDHLVTVREAIFHCFALFLKCLSNISLFYLNIFMIKYYLACNYDANTPVWLFVEMSFIPNQRMYEDFIIIECTVKYSFSSIRLMYRNSTLKRVQNNEKYSFFKYFLRL